LVALPSQVVEKETSIEGFSVSPEEALGLTSGRLAAERLTGPDPAYRSRAWR